MSSTWTQGRKGQGYLNRGGKSHVRDRMEEQNENRRPEKGRADAYQENLPHVIKQIYHRELEYCLECQSRSERCCTISQRTVITLSQVVQVVHCGYRCPDPTCPCRVKVPVVKESTSLGAALYAGLGVGLYHDLGDVTQSIVSFEKTYEPDPATHQLYQDLFEQWTHIYQRSLNMVEEGLVRPLWRAAGT